MNDGELMVLFLNVQGSAQIVRDGNTEIIYLDARGTLPFADRLLSWGYMLTTLGMMRFGDAYPKVLRNRPFIRFIIYYRLWLRRLYINNALPFSMV